MPLYEYACRSCGTRTELRHGVNEPAATRAMPIYEYVCAACEARTEVRHGIDEPPPARCAACGGPLERVFTAPRLNVINSSSPTAARYAKMSPGEEVDR